MKPVEYRGAALYCDGVALADIAAEIGTPCYVYSAAAILENYRAYDTAFGAAPHAVCYALKANGNLAILKLLADAGAGFDIVSGGELYRALKAGGDPRKIVFSGVGKTPTEINAALEAGVFAFNCESEPELAVVDSLAHRLRVRARVGLRVNPDIDASTHRHISTGRRGHKFGIDIGEAQAVCERAQGFENIDFEGVSCHIGSQLLDMQPALEAAGRVLDLIARLRAKGFGIRHMDLGGGLGVAYRPGETKPSPADFVRALLARVEGQNLHLILEPGRSIVGDAGLLLTRVLYRKKSGDTEFVVVDAGMNDLIRPALYDAHHEILPLRQSGRPHLQADVVGPVCETGDFLARGRDIEEVLPGDALAVCTAGAYGFVQASNYNARPKAAEVLIENGAWRVARRRETNEDLVRGEQP